MENHNGIVASDQYEKLKSYPTLPAIGQSDSNVFLAGNGAFLVPARNADVASQSQNGLMSKEDKQKLDGIASGAQVNSVTGVKGNAENSFRTGDINLTPANIGAASSDHNHDSAYAAKSHSHSDYAAVNHNHDSIYAAKSHTHSNASSSANGFMSADDKKKLDGIENGAQVNTVTGIKGNNETAYRTGSVNLTPANIGASPVGHGNHVPETQTANNAVFLRNDNTWQTVTPANIGAAASNHNHDSTYAAKSHTHDYAATNHTHSAATTVAGGFMSADDKKKLNGIAAGAQVNSVTGVKGNSESAYRTGNVNLTAANIGAAASSHTHNYAGSDSAGGSASSAVKLDGFTQATSQTWGQQAGTFINGMLDGDGGSMAWRKNCPSTGKTSYILDGLFYQNEGTYPCLDTSYLPLSIARGGTGASVASTARQNLFPTNMESTANYFIVINGGWQTGGFVTLAKARNRMGLGDTTGALPVANGGTGATSAANARTNLGAAASDHNHDSSYAAKSHTHDYAATNHTHSAATTVAGGFMSADDKKKLNGIASGAQVNSVTGIKGNSESSYRTGNVNLTAANIGAAASSHGNHVPITQTASNKVFLRNDNTWQTVTPANIGAAASSHTHNYAGSDSAGGSATSANKLASAVSIDGISFDGSSGIVRYVKCTTASDVAAKTADLTGFSFVKGALVIMYLENTNTADSPTLNINNTGAKPIYCNNSTHLTEGTKMPRGTYFFVVTGDAYMLVAGPHKSFPRHYINNMDYIANPEATNYFECTTDAATVAKVASNDTYVRLKDGLIVNVYFTIANSASNPTLNLNGLGAKAMYSATGTRLTTTGLKIGLHQFVYRDSGFYAVGE